MWLVIGLHECICIHNNLFRGLRCKSERECEKMVRFGSFGRIGTEGERMCDTRESARTQKSDRVATFHISQLRFSKTKIRTRLHNNTFITIKISTQSCQTLINSQVMSPTEISCNETKEQRNKARLSLPDLAEEVEEWRIPERQAMIVQHEMVQR